MERVTAFVQNDRICLRTPFLYKDVCKLIMGARWNGELRCWTYPAAAWTAVEIAEAFSMNRISGDAEFLALLKEYEALMETQAVKVAEDLPAIPVTKSQPWQHQVQAFWFVVGLWGGLPDAND